MGIKLVTRLCLGLSHLQEHKFKHSFQDTLNPLCNSVMDVESSTHFLLQWPSYINETCTLMSNLNRINPQKSQELIHKLPICTVISYSIIFFRLRLNFVLFYFDYNCKIIVSYLLIVSFSCILLTGG